MYIKEMCYTHFAMDFRGILRYDSEWAALTWFLDSITFLLVVYSILMIMTSKALVKKPFRLHLLTPPASSIGTQT